jgi:CheY-like chemotaxis protein
MKNYIFCVIDDDVIYQFTCNKLISNLNLPFELLSFMNGQEALDYLSENSLNENKLPDFIFLDINMPVMNGWQFLADYANLKNKLCKPNVIYLVSSSIDSEDIEKAEKNSLLTGYINKPISKEKILKATNIQQS